MKKKIQITALLIAAALFIGLAMRAGARDHAHCLECKRAFGESGYKSSTFAAEWK